MEADADSAISPSTVSPIWWPHAVKGREVECTDRPYSLPLLQHDRLAVFEEMHPGGGCQVTDVVCEGHGRQID